MGIASRHGKLRVGASDDETRWSRIEDLLTADVFGAFRYLPPSTGILPFMARAITEDGLTLALWVGEDTWRSITHAEVAFWPSFGRREPDLLVALRTGDLESDVLVLVEAKLHWEMSTIDGLTQLGYYGRRLLGGELDGELFDGALSERRPVVYLTKERSVPESELKKVRGDLEEHVEDGLTEVFWLSWHHARVVAADALDQQEQADAPEHVLALLRDLLDDLAGRGFTARASFAWLFGEENAAGSRWVILDHIADTAFEKRRIASGGEPEPLDEQMRTRTAGGALRRGSVIAPSALRSSRRVEPYPLSAQSQHSMVLPSAAPSDLGGRAGALVRGGRPGGRDDRRRSGALGNRAEYVVRAPLDERRRSRRDPVGPQEDDDLPGRPRADRHRPVRRRTRDVPLERQEALARDAATSGANALVWFDIHGRIEVERGAARWDPVLSLLHELVHAVNITWGNYQMRTSFTAREAQRFGTASPEEESAWIIDNMHRSERGLWLRRRYDGGAMLPPRSSLTPATTGTDLDASETRAVSRLRQRVPILATALGSIDERTCPYNPFRRYRW